MTQAPSRRRFLVAGSGALLAACGGGTAPADTKTDAASEPAEPAPPPASSYFVEESGFVGLNARQGFGFAVGMLVCGNGSEQRQQAALDEIREAHGYRRAVFSRSGGDWFRQRFALAAVEHLLTDDDLEYHCVVIPAEVNWTKRRWTGQADFRAYRRKAWERYLRSYVELFGMRPPARQDRVLLAQRTSKPEDSQAVEDAARAAGAGDVATRAKAKLTSDLMQLADYVTHMIAYPPKRNARWNGRTAPHGGPRETRPVLDYLLGKHLGTSSPADGSLADGGRFRVRVVSEW